MAHTGGKLGESIGNGKKKQLVWKQLVSIATCGNVDQIDVKVKWTGFLLIVLNKTVRIIAGHHR